MKEIRIEGRGPCHFPDTPKKKVEKVTGTNPTRRPADEYASDKPKVGIHRAHPSGDRSDISQEALDVLAKADQPTEESQ